MKNKILIIGFICSVLAIVPFWFILTFFPIKVLSWTSVIVEYNKKIISNNKNRYDYVFVGGSEVLSNIYPKSIKNALSLGVAFGRPMQSYYLLKRFLEANSTPKIVFTTIPFSFYDYQDYHETHIRHDFYTAKDLIEVYKERKSIKQLSFQDQVAYFYRNFLIYFNNPFYYKGVILNIIFGKLDLEIKKSIFDNLVKENGFLDMEIFYNYFNSYKRKLMINAFNNYYKQSIKTSYYERPLSLIQERYLYKIKELSKKYKFELVFFYFPIRTRFYDHTFIKSIRALVAEYKFFKLPYLDNKYYLDEVHLNREGVKLMTSSFKEFIKQRSR